MTDSFNIYCDESCWMQFDRLHVIAWGALICPSNQIHKTITEITQIKEQFGLSRNFEVKWTKVSKGKEKFYFEIVRYFLNNKNLSFRGLVVPDKSILDHESFHQTHDEWYYKMIFNLLKVLIAQKKNEASIFKIFFDYKDSSQAKNLQKLSEVLQTYCSNRYQNKTFHIQAVDSKEVNLIQLSDLLTGATTYRNRNLQTNATKNALIDILEKGTGSTLTKTSTLKEQKINLLLWHPEEKNVF